mmetsp:Transcript_89235/g.213084  ORF Transcript_89235/g.213084 Transcript_89235/m.213084 type:complete len:242 (+) Transcript_89235:1893-2618(+)
MGQSTWGRNGMRRLSARVVAQDLCLSSADRRLDQACGASRGTSLGAVQDDFTLRLSIDPGGLPAIVDDDAPRGHASLREALHTLEDAFGRHVAPVLRQVHEGVPGAPPKQPQARRHRLLPAQAEVHARQLCGSGESTVDRLKGINSSHQQQGRIHLRRLRFHIACLRGKHDGAAVWGEARPEMLRDQGQNEDVGALFRLRLHGQAHQKHLRLCGDGVTHAAPLRGHPPQLTACRSQPRLLR